MAVIGAPETFFGGHANGIAFLFDLTTGEQLQLWRASDFDDFDGFGGAVALEGGYALVSATGVSPVEPNVNRVYVFDVATGTEIATLYPKNGVASLDFGSSVEFVGNQAVISAPFDDGGAENSGKAYLFDLSSLFGCPGDVNDDGLINLGDLNLVLANFGTAGEIGDATGDGLVNLADLNTVLANFGGVCE